jgi:hypothetical protein
MSTLDEMFDGKVESTANGKIDMQKKFKREIAPALSRKELLNPNFKRTTE